jgi:uncharacterized membrane protein
VGHRVVFIDLARALAVGFMLYGHTVDALLAPGYQVGTWFDVWQFQRGLTSSLFLLLSGFAFSIATTRHWSSHLRLSDTVVKRLRRFGLLILLGYGLHFPVARFVLLPTATEMERRALLAVDVLQLIGVTLIVVQALVLVTRSRRLFTIAAFVLTGLLVAITPWVWTSDWIQSLPLPVAAYLSSTVIASQFPLLPWAGFLLLGAGLGQLYARWDSAHMTGYANQVLLVPGAIMVAIGLSERLLSSPLFGPGPWAYIPPMFVVRAGSCLLILGSIAHLSRRIDRLPHVFGAVAQETLLIYFVHLCIVYGSVWNPGLRQAYGAALGPGMVTLFIVLLFVSMTGLAWYWNWWKHVRPRAARWTSAAAMAALLARLL